MVVLVEQDIGGFDITMEQTQPMEVGYCARELFKDDPGLLQGEHVCIEPVFERSTLHIGHDQVMISSRVACIKTGNNMLMAQSLHDLNFTMHHSQLDQMAI